MFLTGKRILITRTREQASHLAALVEAAGAKPILIPTIELGSPTSFCGLDAALAGLHSFDWLLFTSANAVHAFAERSRALEVLLIPKKIAVIGPATARAVSAIGLSVDLIPPQFIAESLAESLLPYAPGSAMLLVRAEQARDVLPETLTAAGAQVTVASAYRSLAPKESIASLQLLFADPAHYPDAITFTSASTATNLFALLESAGIVLPRHIARVSIGPITSRTLAELGYPATSEAAEPSVASLCQSLIDQLSAKRRDDEQS